MAETTTDPTLASGTGGGRTIGGLPRGPVALVLGVVLLVGALVIGRSVLDDDSGCEALVVPVDSLASFDWDNGITSSGAEWISVLTEGVTHADQPSRARIAVAVQGDGDGYERFRGALPDDLEPAADRLRELALDPDESYRRRDDPEVEQDVTAIDGHGVTACNFAP